MKTNKEYKKEPNQCPNCDSISILSWVDHIELGDDTGWRPWECLKCRMKWHANYKLTGYWIAVEPPPKEEEEFSDKETVEEETRIEQRAEAKSINEE